MHFDGSANNPLNFLFEEQLTHASFLIFILGSNQFYPRVRSSCSFVPFVDKETIR